MLAQDEARALRHNYIGTEHILLGLLRAEEGVAARALESLDIVLEEVRAQVARIVGQGDELATGHIPFTPRAKKVLELSLREARSLAHNYEARSLGHNYIGAEHILLGLARENDGVAARILHDFGADADRIRDAVSRSLPGPGRRRADVTGEVAPDSPPSIEFPERQYSFSLARPPRGVAHFAPARKPWEDARAATVAAFGMAIGILLGWIIWGLH